MLPEICIYWKDEFNLYSSCQCLEGCWNGLELWNMGDSDRDGDRDSQPYARFAGDLLGTA